MRKAVSKDACKLCRWGSRRLLGLSFVTFSWYISKLFVFAFSSWWGVFLKSFPLTAVNRALSGYLSHFQPQWNHSHFIAICCCVKQAAEVSSSSTSSSLVFNAGTLLPACDARTSASFPHLLNSLPRASFNTIAVFGLHSLYRGGTPLSVFSCCPLGLCLPSSVSQKLLVHGHPGIGSFTQIVSSHKALSPVLFIKTHGNVGAKLYPYTYDLFHILLTICRHLCWCIVLMCFTEEVQSILAVEHGGKKALHSFWFS